MYSVRLGYNNAVRRINKLIKNNHNSESFVTTVFTIEKTIRRSVTELIISAGFKSKLARKYVKSLSGQNRLIIQFEFFDPLNRDFDELFTRDLRIKINEWGTMRNKIVHGERVYGIDLLKKATKDALEALEKLKDSLTSHYDYDGWEKLTVRKKSTLHQKPTIKIHDD